MVMRVSSTWSRWSGHHGQGFCCSRGCESAPLRRRGIGLVDRVVADAELWDATLEIAPSISGNAPLAIQAAKITIAQVLKDPDQRDVDAIKAIGVACMDSEDFREGRRAFMEKRKPHFRGR